MNPELKEKWLIALRSGDYSQCKLVLGDENGSYCCLGVLCKISNIPFIKDNLLEGNRWDDLGLTGKDKTILITMNDDQDKSFNEIADWIQEHM